MDDMAGQLLLGFVIAPLIVLGIAWGGCRLFAKRNLTKQEVVNILAICIFIGVLRVIWPR